MLIEGDDQAAARAEVQASHDLTYAVVTPVRDEVANLRRLALCLRAQILQPLEWIIVDNGSTDGSSQLAATLARRAANMRVLTLPGGEAAARGAQIARAAEAGFAAIGSDADVIVICDADVSAASDFFQRLLGMFAADPLLGIASGSRYEFVGGQWRQRFVTGTSVEGQCRAYRAACLREILPLEKNMGWDGVDEAKARVQGWHTGAFRELPFRHHRQVGARERSRFGAWSSQGAGAHYMGYRPSYLLLRALFRSCRDPAALGLISGYVMAGLRRTSRCADDEARNYVRHQQSLRNLLSRLREASGHGYDRRAGTDLLLVADAGGHLLELVMLSESLAEFSRVWVTHDTSNTSSLLRGQEVHFAHGPTCRSLKNFLRNLVLAWRIVGEVRPSAVVTTGAALGVPFAWIARLRGGAVVIFVEIFGVGRPTLSCRLVRPVADRVYVQWPELTSVIPGATYVGPSLSEVT
jgi:glycosyltransferase involved in cell wall biosynthesis